MMTLVTVIHVVICALLIVIILIQAGRGGGLVEGFSGVESMFGTKTNNFLTRTTTTLSILFFLTCLSLAFLSAKQSQSLMRNLKTKTESVTQNTTKTEIPKEAASTQAEEKVTPATVTQNTTEIPKTE